MLEMESTALGECTSADIADVNDKTDSSIDNMTRG